MATCTGSGPGWDAPQVTNLRLLSTQVENLCYVGTQVGNLCYVGTQVENLCYVGSCYFAAASSAFFRSSTISFWMLPGVGRYFANSIVNTPWPCVMLRRSVE